MSSKSRNQNNLQHRPSQTIQAVTAYQGLIPPPDMMERFKALDPNLPERIIRMTERSFDRADRELEIISETHKTDLNIKQHEAETRRLTVNEDARYNFRAQMIILIMVLAVLGTAILLGWLGLTGIAYLVVGGGFATIIIAAIKGVSGKIKL
jgi:uncharacterized membrane protein